MVREEDEEVKGCAVRPRVTLFFLLLCLFPLLLIGLKDSTQLLEYGKRGPWKRPVNDT